MGISLIPGSWQDPASGGGVIRWQESDGAEVHLYLPVGHHLSDARIIHVRLERDHERGRRAPHDRRR